MESGNGEPLLSHPGQQHPPNLDLGRRQNVDVDVDDITFLGSGLSMEEKNEVLVVARNSLEILSSLLNSEKPDEAIKARALLPLGFLLSERRAFVFDFGQARIFLLMLIRK